MWKYNNFKADGRQNLTSSAIVCAKLGLSRLGPISGHAEMELITIFSSNSQ